MNAVRELFASGGPAFVAILVLSVLLYERSLHLVLDLRRRRRELVRLLAGPASGAAGVPRMQQELQETFREQRIAISAMIAAAPLLGLLGTVNGMIASFESLAAQGVTRSMEGMARGISEVLIDTESGLMVAIPGLLLLYLAQRQMEKGIQAAARPGD
jgi:MotA/TolQ/ExbB proton channel family